MRGVFFVVAALLCGCGTQDFTVAQDLPAQTVPGDALGGLLGSVFPQAFALTIDLKAEEQKHDTGPASHVYLQSMSLSVTGPGNFDFLSGIHLFAAASTSPDQKVEIAKKDPVAKGQTTIDFDVIPQVDLIQMVQAGVEITATATGQKPTQDTSIDGHVVIDVKI
jgi:hypothetical protein